jgi:uncharacterized protein (DUF4415 family)
MKKDYDLKKLKIKRRGVLPELAAKKKDCSKIRITISLDCDVVDYFKSEAEAPGAFPYQTQINQALRGVMDHENPSNHDEALAELKSELLHDPLFLRELAKKVLTEKPRKSK